jgi:hypothetical protein
MKEVYRRYIIRSGAQEMRHGSEWKPIAQINWTEDGTERVKLWMEWCFMRSFASYKEAEMEAHVFAKDWIDNKNQISATDGSRASSITVVEHQSSAHNIEYRKRRGR